MILLPLLLAVLHGTPTTLPSGTTFSGREHQLAVKIPRLDASVVIDGLLNEPVWREAALLHGFSQYAPTDGIAAADSTQVLVWYSATAIHFGIRAFQPAGTVRATLADRDRISSDDNVQLLLSTFNDGRQASVFMVNPLGVQADGTLVERGNQVGGSFLGGAVSAREAPDLSPDFVFESKGHVTDWGYEVEIRIPFKTLRYQSADVQSWGFNVVRVVQYRGHENSWAPALRANASFLGQGGTLTGLTDLHRGIVVDITPELTQRTDGLPAAAGSTNSWAYSAGAPKLGGTVRWGVTNNLTLNGTANPDFSQVEADASQISFDPRAALSFPEKRPFFLDGSDQFAVPNSLVYTRRIVQPVGAVKLTGKIANYDVGLLTALDAMSSSTSGKDNPLFNVVRLQRDLGASSRVGMMFTDRENGANWNRVVDLDGRFVFEKVYALQLQLAGSSTERAGIRTAAPLWEARLNRNGRAFSWRSQFTGIADDFRTETGFIARTGQVHASWVPRYTWFGERGSAIEQFTYSMVVDGIWAYRNWQHQGDARDKKLHFVTDAQLHGGWDVGASLLLETFGYDPIFYSTRYRIEKPRPGLPSDTLAFTGTPRLPNRDFVLSLTTPQFKYFSFNAVYIWGQDENFYEWSSANITYLSLSADVRPSEQMRLSLLYQLNDYRRIATGKSAGRQVNPRVKMEYQVNREIFVRVIGDYFSDYTSELFDDTRTGYPLLELVGTTWTHLAPRTNNSLHGEFLFAYKPTPGTVFYAGYGSQLTEPDAFRFKSIVRTSDSFFVKVSYLFRL